MHLLEKLQWDVATSRVGLWLGAKKPGRKWVGEKFILIS